MCVYRLQTSLLHFFLELHAGVYIGIETATGFSAFVLLFIVVAGVVLVRKRKNGRHISTIIIVLVNSYLRENN